MIQKRATESDTVSLRTCAAAIFRVTISLSLSLSLSLCLSHRLNNSVPPENMERNDGCRGETRKMPEKEGVKKMLKGGESFDNSEINLEGLKHRCLSFLLFYQ